jgi:hypothetical protein
LDNDLGEAKSVTVSGTNVLNNNLSIGLLISSHGAITLNNITANNNSPISGDTGAQITNVGSAVPQFVKLNGTNTFNGNGGYGLDITSDGAITTNNVTANDNGNNGAFLANDGGLADGGITMTGINSFLNNGSNGLSLSSWDTITLSKITADGNSGDGLNVASDAHVTLTCGTFSNNGSVGLFANVLGNLTLKGVTSSGNTGGDYNLSYGGSLIVVRTC